MSTLWTPSGERPVGRQPSSPAPGPASGPPASGPGGGSGGPGPPGGLADDDPELDPAAEAELEELRRQLASAPASVVIANHCYGLFELAAVYLSQAPPRLGEAQLAIDALGYITDGLGERLGDVRSSLQEALAQIRLAFVQLKAVEDARSAEQSGANGSAGAVEG